MDYLQRIGFVWYGLSVADRLGLEWIIFSGEAWFGMDYLKQIGLVKYELSIADRFGLVWIIFSG